MVLFGILFLWQFPHTLAITRLYREDYARGGIRLLPANRAVAEAQALAGCLALLLMGLLPTLIGLTGQVYLLGALALGVGLLEQAPPRLPPNRGDDSQPPFRDPNRQPVIDPARLGMLIFLGSETMLFAGFIAAFMVFRLGAPLWPPPFQPRLPMEVTGVNTAVLLVSGYTMWRALRAIRYGDRAGMARSLAQTALLGATFLGVQGYEWGRLLEFGLTASSGVYGGAFYTLIGAHAVHVLAALTWLLIILIRTARGRYTAEDHAGVSLCGIYWYFVVALWPVLYTLVYLA